MFLLEYLLRRLVQALAAIRERPAADADADNPDEPDANDDPDPPYFRRELGEGLSYFIFYLGMVLGVLLVIASLLGLLPGAWGAFTNTMMENRTIAAITDQQFYRRQQIPEMTSFYDEKANGSQIPEIIDVRAIYTGTSGVARFKTVRSSNLSGASWIWKFPGERTDDLTYSSDQEPDDPSQTANDKYENMNSMNRLVGNGEANLDAESDIRASDREKEICHVLSLARGQVYDCNRDVKKLMAMLQSKEADITAESVVLTRIASDYPEELICLDLDLKYEYYEKGIENMKSVFSPKFEDPSLYHYAIFSDNVLATSVVINSVVTNARKPAKHVFHIATDTAISVTAMKMWFTAHPPGAATIQVENVDDFTWRNSTYFPIIGKPAIERLKKYPWKDMWPLKHYRFYLPDIYPKLDKILLLDEDTVVQKDLTALWYIDLKGMANGAVETCKKSDPKGCGNWALGMNIFDLKEWKRGNITGIYRHLQNMNDDMEVWRAIPAGLIAFYNLTQYLNPRWHLLKLGSETGIGQKHIEKAAVITVVPTSRG